MANKSLFKSLAGRLIPATRVRNEAGGKAYELPSDHQLAQYVMTGCLNGTYYASAEDQLEKVLDLAKQCETGFVARLAVYARRQGYMKDTPALLCALLASRDGKCLEKVFPRVIDNGKMLRNFVQIMRSGVTGRKSLGTLPKRLVRQWFERCDDETLFEASVGQDPSLGDVIKMVHPRPRDMTRDALYDYLTGSKNKEGAWPAVVRQYEDYKAGRSSMVPDVPFQFLTYLPLDRKAWVEIARQAPWQMTRMNLNTFLRHGVFEVEGMIELVSMRLANRELIRKARVFPYQLLMAYQSVQEEMPGKIREALQDAMEIATSNVPSVEGRVVVCPDVSGSMSSPVTGKRKGATSSVRCIDVAALVSACVVRQNPQALIMPFEQEVVKVDINPRDSIMTNAQKLAAIGGGGTNGSAPLARLNESKAMVDLVIFISDNESWMDVSAGRGTETMRQWSLLKKRCPRARMVCIDIQPYGTVQAVDQEDILNVGGFSDQVFDIIGGFAEHGQGAEHWVELINKVEL